MARTVDDESKINTLPQMCRDKSNLSPEELAKCAELEEKFDNKMREVFEAQLEEVPIDFVDDEGFVDTIYVVRLLCCHTMGKGWKDKQKVKVTVESM